MRKAAAPDSDLLATGDRAGVSRHAGDARTASSGMPGRGGSATVHLGRNGPRLRGARRRRRGHGRTGRRAPNKECGRADS
jgi:hypothetical protein